MSLITISQLNDSQVEEIISRSQDFSKTPPANQGLEGKLLVNLFYEPSTRTSASFSVAAQRLGMQVISITEDSSSIKKGESLQDTVRTLSQYDPAVIILRHPNSGAAQLAQEATEVPIINAGDGSNQHPTQALTDLYVLRNTFNRLKGLKLWMVGDLLSSRVARSNLELFKRYHLDLTLCGPPPLLPESFLDCKTSYQLDGIEEAEVIYVLRFQTERHYIPIPDSLKARYQITADHLKQAYLMHPGPAIRGAEVSAEALDHPQSLVLEQVKAGLYVRMAVLALTAGNPEK